MRVDAAAIQPLLVHRRIDVLYPHAEDIRSVGNALDGEIGVVAQDSDSAFGILHGGAESVFEAVRIVEGHRGVGPNLRQPAAEHAARLI